MVKYVDPTWLASCNTDHVLIIDARTADEYAAGCVKDTVHNCCVGVVLRRLHNGSLKVDSLLNCEEDKQKYEIAKQSEGVCVVVYDQSSATADALPKDSIAALMLKKVSRECKFVTFLLGGFEGFSSRFPSLCDTPDYLEDGLLKK